MAVDLLQIGAEQRRHGAFARRHGALHGVAAQPEEARGLGDREAAGSGERAVFAEGMSGDERRRLRQGSCRRRARCTRSTASDTAIKAGWAFSVRVSSSGGPSNMSFGEALA